MSDSTLRSVGQPDVERQPTEIVKSTGDDSCRVVIHNDDVTPFDYVIGMLEGVFMLSEELAEHIAWSAHTKGHAVVVVRPRPDAEKLAKIANGRAKLDGYPLTFSLEAD
jgi:ATP-dependent Clp protease adaptor protein ClpS